MKNLWFLLIFLGVLIGCETINTNSQSFTPVTEKVQLPDFVSEQATAVDCSEIEPIALYGMEIRKKHNDILCWYTFASRVYNQPIKNIFMELIFESSYGLKNIGFPLSGSTDHKILWDCMDNLVKHTGIKKGYYFELRVKKYYNQNSFNNNKLDELFDSPDLFFIGRYEGENGIWGYIYRKP